jgi:hypothetical protein
MDIMDMYPTRVMPEPNSGCWLWTGALNKGYGRARRNNKVVYIHQVSYGLKNGPTELHVLHRCDVPCCVNPDHLEEGTHRQNMLDGYARGRINSTGENNSMAKLTREDVEAIRTNKKWGDRAEVAARYGIRPLTVSFIRTGRRWS